MRWNFSLSAFMADAFGKLEDIVFRIRADYLKAWIIVLVIAGGLFVYLFFPEFETRQLPGMLVTSEPKQTALPANASSFAYKNYSIKPMAAYDITARVIAKRRYYFGRDADIAPIDLTLGWQIMSDTSILDHYSFHISSRYASWRYRSSPIADEDVSRHSSNNHLIPATPAIEHKLAQAHVGDIIHLIGYLVNVQAADGYEWASSLTRNDEGWGACELMYVESVE